MTHAEMAAGVVRPGRSFLKFPRWGNSKSPSLIQTG
jgi:hypothetical protein